MNPYEPQALREPSTRRSTSTPALRPNQLKMNMIRIRAMPDARDLLARPESAYIHSVSPNRGLRYSGRWGLLPGDRLRRERSAAYSRQQTIESALTARARAACDRVAQKHRDRHRADAAGTGVIAPATR